MTNYRLFVLTLLCVALLSQTVSTATYSRRPRRRPRRPRLNKCSAVNLHLPETVVDLLATTSRTEVGTVSLRTGDRRNLITNVSLVPGCSLVHAVKVNVFPGHSLARVQTSKFPCKKIGVGSSLTLSCPIKKFGKIKNCCAEHFVIAVHAIVSCRGLREVGWKATAWAAADPSDRCTSPRGWCNYVPVKLAPKCKQRGCYRNTPVGEVCKLNKCKKILQTPCKDFCDASGNPVGSACDATSGTCIETPEDPCENKCEGNTPIMSTCVYGACQEYRKPPCTGACDGDTPISSTCEDGQCVEGKGEPCIDKCDGDTPISSTCENGGCVEERGEPCTDKCDGDTPISSTCEGGGCVEERREPCTDKCDGDTPISSTCEDGGCVEERGEPCTDKCDGDTPITSTCEGGGCVEERKEPCTDKCDGDTPINSICEDGGCVEERREPCTDKCDGDTPITSICEGGGCVEERGEPCTDKCDGDTPITSTCEGGGCVEERREPCTDKCDGETPINSTCEDGECVEERGEACMDTCEGNTLVMRGCKDGSCSETSSPCGQCETCTSTGAGATCVKKTCDPGEKLNDSTCECCPVCEAGQFVGPDGCSCVDEPCDACPDGSVCSSYLDGSGNQETFCRDCDCGYCLNGVDCCRINASGVNCVPNRAELPPSEQCKSNDYEGFPDNPKNDVCRGEEKVDETLAQQLVDTCGCVPSSEVACTLASPPPGAKCFIARKDGLHVQDL